MSHRPLAFACSTGCGATLRTPFAKAQPHDRIQTHHDQRRAAVGYAWNRGWRSVAEDALCPRCRGAVAVEAAP